jgi:PTH2 family peptidyl-tRNA hydrolase
VKAVLKTGNRKLAEWNDGGAKKVVLKVDSKKELINFKRAAEEAGLKAALITDAAKTFFKRPTTTTLGIGPDDDEKIDGVTGTLQMY